MVYFTVKKTVLSWRDWKCLPTQPGKPWLCVPGLDPCMWNAGRGSHLKPKPEPEPPAVAGSCLPRLHVWQWRLYQRLPPGTGSTRRRPDAWSQTAPSPCPESQPPVNEHVSTVVNGKVPRTFELMLAGLLTHWTILKKSEEFTLGTQIDAWKSVLRLFFHYNFNSYYIPLKTLH